MAHSMIHDFRGAINQLIKASSDPSDADIDKTMDPVAELMTVLTSQQNTRTEETTVQKLEHEACNNQKRTAPAVQVNPTRPPVVHQQRQALMNSDKPETQQLIMILPKPLSADSIKQAADMIDMLRSNVRHIGDLQTEIHVNSKCFDAASIHTYTRLESLECRIPAVRCPTKEEIIYGNTAVCSSLCDVFQQKYMPGVSSLLSWKCQLEEHGKQAQGELLYVSTDCGSYTLTDIKHMLALHRAAATRKNVERELEWFAHTHIQPRSVRVQPEVKSIRKFQGLLFCTKWDAEFENYCMSVAELAKICCVCWLTANHVTWAVKQLNKIQSQTLCIYDNGIDNIEKLISGLSPVPYGRPQPSSLLFIFRVGKSGFSQVFINAENQPGFHYTMCYLDTNTKRIIYADSLGWKVPEILPKYLIAYHTAVYGTSDMRDYEWCICHEPIMTNSTHSCTPRCAVQYPLQTCLSICGPVVIVMAATACLQRDVFLRLTSSNQQAVPQLAYLQAPTKYACYLRKVLAAWIAENGINLEYIIPSEIAAHMQQNKNLHWSNNSENHASDPEDDIPEIPSPSQANQGSTEPVSLQVHTEEGGKIFKCPCCQKTSKKGFNIKRHILRVHPDQDLKALEEGNCLCLHCGRKFRRICDLRQHLQKCHATIFSVEQITFDSMQEFESWKASLEEAESCFFAQYSGFRNKGGSKFRYLQCNRSGIYKQRGMGKRQSKLAGTCKIDNNCTASIKVTCQAAGKVDIEYHRTHYGHQKDLELMWLPRKKREEIVTKLAQGISRDCIMDDMRDSGGEIERQQELLQLGGAYDIKKSLGVQTFQKSLNEKDSVLAWILQWQATEENPVLFYKLPGPNPNLTLDLLAEDYVIILQSPFQKHMMQKFAGRGVWCDSTQGTNAYDFHMMTLMTVNEFGEGFPMAWCISNREDESTIRIFFNKVKENCGDLMSCWFMADKAFVCHNIWTSVFWGSPRMLICPWHVELAWKEELKNEIRDLSVQVQVYKMLCVVLEQQDETSFQDSLQRLLARLAISEKTMSFRRYFIKEWVPKMHQWASCYRTGHGLNPGIFTDAFHVVFKQIYKQGLVNSRVDSCLVHLLKYIRDRLFNWMVKFPQVKVTMRVKLIHDHHLRSMLLSFNRVKQLDDPESWSIQSEDQNNSFVVERLSTACPLGECKLRCEECGVCVHLFLCNCPDCLINSTICKHIHLIQRLVRLQILIQNEENKTSEGETDKLKCCLSSTLRQMTSMVEAADDSNLETLKELEKMLSASHQLLTSGIQQTNSAGQDACGNKRPEIGEFFDQQSKKIKL